LYKLLLEQTAQGFTSSLTDQPAAGPFGHFLGTAA